MNSLKPSCIPHSASHISRSGVPKPTLHSSLRTPHSKAFTLIELLVVIAIIAILAGIVLGGAAYATAFAHKARAQSELFALCTAIDAYKAKTGNYPPCNVSNTTVITTHSSLFYELTGTTNVSQNTVTVFTSLVNGESLDTSGNQHSVQWQFGTPGFKNTSPDPTEIKNYYSNMKNDQHGALYQKGTSGPTYSLLILSVHGPRDFPSGGSQIYNFWHYVSSENANPGHNKDSYDLWGDIVVHGKTNRISNWSKTPEIVNDWED